MFIFSILTSDFLKLHCNLRRTEMGMQQQSRSNNGIKYSGLTSFGLLGPKWNENNISNRNPLPRGEWFSRFLHVNLAILRDKR